MPNYNGLSAVLTLSHENPFEIFSPLLKVHKKKCKTSSPETSRLMQMTFTVLYDGLDIYIHERL